MKKVLVFLALIGFSLPSLAEVKEFSPTKVIVDVTNGKVLREPTALDYEFALMNKQTKDANKSVVQKVFGRKKCGR